MNDISTTARQLPNTVEDLAKFVLIGREKLNAVRAEIRAIEKVQLAAEVHEQKLQEAQEIAEAVLDAETKLGELTKAMETAQGKRKDLEHSNTVVTKSEQLKEIGIDKMTAHRFEQLAAHPEQVERAKADAKAEGRIVTRQDVLMRIAPPKTNKQTMTIIKKEAYREHDAFNESKKESVVSMADIQKDKLNKEVVINNTSMMINKALSSVEDLGLIKAQHLDEYSRGADDLDRVIEQMYKCMEILEYLIEKLGG